MDTGNTRSTHVTKLSNMAARAGLVEYRVVFATLGAVSSVLIDLLAVAANWIDDPCKQKPFADAARMRTELLIWR